MLSLTESYAQAESRLYFTHEFITFGDVPDAVERVDADGTDRATVFNSTEVSGPIGVAVDPAGGKLYWTERSGKIRRSNLDGTGAADLITGLNQPFDIAVDIPHGKLYWTDPNDNAVYTANLDGTGAVTTGAGLNMPAYLDLDLTNNKLYVSNFGNGTITQCTLIGSGCTTIVASLSEPTGIAVDAAGGKIYYATNSGATIYKADLDGSNQQTVVTGGFYWGLEKDPLLPVLYVAESSKLTKVNTDGTGSVDLVTTIGTARGVAIYADADNDGIVNQNDNCPLVSNVSQLDTNTDGEGDACDADDDGDGAADGSDNCPLVSNVSQTNTDGDGSGDACDSDDDNDGLTDTQEASLGTDPLDPDSDNDQVSDGQEVTDGSNPGDSGSALRVLGTTMCTEWNGFFQGGMWNIMEHVNLAGSSRSVQSTLYSIDGSPQSTVSFNVAGGGQTDLLVHDMTGRANESFGKVCSSVSSITPDIDGRMVYYYPVAGSFDFAYAMPFLKGLSGRQLVSFNTFQPSFDPADTNNLAANWIQVTNLADSAQTGTLRFYGQDGSVLGTSAVSIAGGARADFSGHQFGQNLAGTAEWEPTDAAALFQVRNVRYFYSNPGTSNRFSSAVQLVGEKGSGENLIAPLDTSIGTAVLEVANARSTATDVTVRIYRSDGTAASTSDLTLPAKGSVHIIADSILNGTVGSGAVDAAQAEGVVVSALHYGRSASGSINFVYETPGIQALGSVLRGSYNTFLNQECDLYLVNSSASSTTAAVTMTRESGTVVLNGDVVNLPAHGAVRYDLCSRDQDNTYGVVTVQPAAANLVAAYVVRRGQNDAYRFSTPVRQ